MSVSLLTNKLYLYPPRSSYHESYSIVITPLFPDVSLKSKKFVVSALLIIIYPFDEVGVGPTRVLMFSIEVPVLLYRQSFPKIEVQFIG